MTVGKGLTELAAELVILVEQQQITFDSWVSSYFINGNHLTVLSLIKAPTTGPLL